MVIRNLLQSDIPEAMKLVMAENWNQTENDWQFLIQQPENRCIAAEVDGKLVGTTTAAVYSGQLAWIGMVLVNPNFRGKGIGKLLLSSIIQQLNHIQSVKLDATPAGQPVYKKLKFQEEYRILRMKRKPSAFQSAMDIENHIAEVGEEHIPALVNFDAEIFGVNRKGLIGYLQSSSVVKSLQVFQNNELSGFLLGREGNKYIQLGPVSAVSSSIALSLIFTALKELSHKPVLVDVPEDKTEFISWLKSAGFEIQRPFVRMFRDKNPYPGNPGKQYLICGPEFG